MYKVVRQQNSPFPLMRYYYLLDYRETLKITYIKVSHQKWVLVLTTIFKINLGQVNRDGRDTCIVTLRL